LLTLSKNALRRVNESEHKGFQKIVDELPEFNLKPGIKLKTFQKLGVTFLLKCREKYEFALLGNEMEVGKVSPFRLDLLIRRPFKH
jgi:hypothetical protein